MTPCKMKARFHGHMPISLKAIKPKKTPNLIKGTLIDKRISAQFP